MTDQQQGQQGQLGQLGQVQGQGQGQPLGLIGVQLGEGQLEKFQKSQGQQSQGQQGLGQGIQGQGMQGGMQGQGAFRGMGRFRGGRFRGGRGRGGRGRGRGGRGGRGRGLTATIQYYKQLAESKDIQGPYKNFLLTGPPETGKTTIMKKLVQLLESQKEDIAFTGFLSTEIRTGVVRQGFQIVPVGDAAQHVQPWVLGHMNLTDPSMPTVSKYGVDVDTFSKNVPECFKFKDTEDKLKVVVIDEIAMMECFSDVFQREVEKLLDDEDVILFATVGQRGSDFMDKIRHRQDVFLRVLPNISEAISENIPDEMWENVCMFLDEDDDEIPEEEITGKMESTNISEKQVGKGEQEKVGKGEKQEKVKSAAQEVGK